MPAASAASASVFSKTSEKCSSLAHGLHELEIKTHAGAVTINGVQQNFTGTELLTDLGQLDGIHVPAFPAPFDGTLKPTVLLATRARHGRLDAVPFGFFG